MHAHHEPGPAPPCLDLWGGGLEVNFLCRTKQAQEEDEPGSPGPEPSCHHPSIPLLLVDDIGGGGWGV